MNRRLSIGIVGVCIVWLVACGGSPASNSATPNAATQPPSQTSKSTPASTPSGTAHVPPACGLLTTADIEKITGYGNGLADAQDMGENETSCVIVAEQGKFRVQMTAGPGMFPVLPTEKTVALEAGGKGVVKDSGIGQGWMSLVVFPDYTVTMLLGGGATKMDFDNKIATVTKADGSTMTYEQAYEALARAVAHNAASGAQVPSSVTNVNDKGDACALLTLEDVQGVMTDFTITGPESGPSTYGGNMCRFRGHSDTLQTTGIVGVVFLTQQQFQSLSAMGNGNKSDLGGVTEYDFGKGLGIILNKGSGYVRLSVDLLEEDPAKLEQIETAYKTWTTQLAQKIAARM